MENERYSDLVLLLLFLLSPLLLPLLLLLPHTSVTLCFALFIL